MYEIDSDLNVGKNVLDFLNSVVRTVNMDGNIIFKSSFYEYNIHY